MSKFNVNDTVYCIDSLGQITEGKIQNIRKITSEFNPVIYYVVHTNIGEFTCLELDTFKTYDTAKAEMANRSENKRKEYERHINNLPQLFSFMLRHMHCEEYTNYEAIQASRNKIKELIGIEI